MDINDRSPQNEPTRWKRSFFTLAFGQTLSLIGSSAVQFSLIWWLTAETSSALMLSLAGLFAFLPQLFFGPFAGVWIDRMKRKTVIIGADVFIALAAAVFALLFYLGEPPYWSAFIILGARAFGNVFHAPAVSAALPMIVPQDELMRANGWNQFLQSGAFMLGPVLGAAMYAALPLSVILLTDIIGAAIACVCVAIIKIPDPPKDESRIPNVMREMKEGAGYLLRDRRLFIVTLAATLCMIFYLPLSSLYPLMTGVHFSGTAWHAGLIELVYAAGMMASAAIIGARGEIKHKFRMIHIALIVFGMINLVCGILPADISYFWIFAVLCIFMGMTGNLYSIPYMTYLQQTIPPEAQGRVFSLITTLMCLAMPLGLLIAGPFAEANGVVMWFLVAGGAMIAIMSASAVIVSRISQKEE